MSRLGRLLKIILNTIWYTVVGKLIQSDDCKWILISFFINISSFFKSIDFNEKIVAPKQQVGRAVNFGVKFNDAVPNNRLNFAPKSCDVINVNNEEEVYHLWDSTDEMMCIAEQHPVNFEIIMTPYSKGTATYGFQYTGNI